MSGDLPPPLCRQRRFVVAGAQLFGLLTRTPELPRMLKQAPPAEPMPPPAEATPQS